MPHRLFPIKDQVSFVIQLGAVPQHPTSRIQQGPFGIPSYPPVLTLYIRRSMHAINDRMHR